MCPPGQRLCYFDSTCSRRQNDALFDTFGQIWAPLRYKNFFSKKKTQKSNFAQKWSKYEILANYGDVRDMAPIIGPICTKIPPKWSEMVRFGVFFRDFINNSDIFIKNSKILRIYCL